MKQALYILDPYDDDQVELFSFEDTVLAYINKIRNNMNSSEYKENKKNNNEIEEFLFTMEDNKIKDYCHLQGEKDIKVCHITFPLMNLRKRPLLTLASAYASSVVEAEEVFIKIDPKDKDTIKILEDSGFESLGEEGNILIYLQDKELELNTQRKI